MTDTANPTQIDRRSLTKTMAWTIPIISTAITSPGMAASVPAGCPTSACWVVGGAPTYTVANNGLLSGTTYPNSVVTLNMGTWGLATGCYPASSAYYRVNITSITGVDTAGNTWTGSSITGGLLQYGVGVGGVWGPSATFLGFTSAIAPIWSSTNRLTRFTITYTIEYLNILFTVLSRGTGCSVTEIATCTSASNCGQGTLAKL